MAPEVEKAVALLKANVDGDVAVTALADGGAQIRIDKLGLGPPYAQDESWFGFTLTYLHPYGDIYPHFVRPDLTRLDGGPLGEAIHAGNAFYGQPAVMVSRRTRIFGPANPVDPVLKLLKVQQWMLSR
jgi:hypothetical protein